METEDSTKSLNFLDASIKNNNGKYELRVYRKNAITNVQVKPNSAHDPKVLKSIFTGFLHRAYKICDSQFRQEEINFLINNFIENGYDKNSLKRIESDYQKTREETREDRDMATEHPKIVKLPWIPELSPKLRKSFRKAGYKAVFKSTANLKTLLTSKNKSDLPSNSQPGVYMINCKCGKGYVGETKLKVSTRITQHEKNVSDEKWDVSGITNHARTCEEGFEWDKTSTLKIEENKFDRKVREALEIQYRGTSPRNDHGLNLDDGQYVTTNFWKPMLSHLREKSLY